jgi:hypothetical protein
MNDLFEAEAEAIAGFVAAALRETPQYASAMIAYGYHSILEATMHPHNLEAVSLVREVAGLEIVHGPHPDVALSKMQHDAVAVCEFLGVTPDHQCVNDDPGDDYLAQSVKERVRPMVEEALAKHLQDLPADSRPN